jgi:hypothetical protein
LTAPLQPSSLPCEPVRRCRSRLETACGTSNWSVERFTGTSEIVARRSVESSSLTVAIEPGDGGRVVSIVSAASNREWLVTAKEPGDRAMYGDSFTDRDIYGWDEMLPTINACQMGGRAFPDHGEVWAVEWASEPAHHHDGVRLRTTLRSMPLTLAREIWADGPLIILDYELSNAGPIALPAQWAAHPQFAVTANAHLQLGFVNPDVTASSDAIAGYLWANAVEAAADLAPGSHLKVWFDQPNAAQSATISEGSDVLRMRWTGSDVRNLAVLWDNHQFSSERVLAIEPAFDLGDSLASTSAREGSFRIPPNATIAWRITLEADVLIV